MEIDPFPPAEWPTFLAVVVLFLGGFVAHLLDRIECQLVEIRELLVRGKAQDAD